jgi:hypothetical protein
MKKSKHRLKKSGQQKRNDQDRKERPEETAEQQERNQKEQKEIPENQGAKRFSRLFFRLCFHIFDPCSLMTGLCIRPSFRGIYSASAGLLLVYSVKATLYCQRKSFLI